MNEPLTSGPGSAGPPDRYRIGIGATHLYPGVRLAVPRPAAEVSGMPDAEAPGCLTLLFSDGVSVRADLVHVDRGRLALRVDAYSTHAGTRLPEKLWTARLGAGEADGLIELVLGRAYPAPGVPGHPSRAREA